jgi:hypothetical protein
LKSSLASKVVTKNVQPVFPARARRQVSEKPDNQRDEPFLTVQIAVNTAKKSAQRLNFQRFNILP